MQGDNCGQLKESLLVLAVTYPLRHLTLILFVMLNVTAGFTVIPFSKVIVFCFRFFSSFSSLHFFSTLGTFKTKTCDVILLLFLHSCLGIREQHPPTLPKAPVKCQVCKRVYREHNEVWFTNLSHYLFNLSFLEIEVRMWVNHSSPQPFMFSDYSRKMC
jgi:hypothetical protein